MRTRWLVPLAILLLTAFLTMGIAAAAERPDALPVDSLEEEAVSTGEEQTLLAFLLPLLPIFSGGEALSEDDMGAGVDNRQH
jgi:hypothetical protein